MPLVPVGVAAGSGQACHDATLRVVVTNALNGEPVSGVLVSIAGQTATTDTRGTVTITGLPEGEQQVAVSASGYIQQSSAVALTCGEAEVASVSFSSA